MSREINIRRDRKAGRITLCRPEALNALTYDMCRKISAALDDWETDPTVAVVVIDGEGKRAFCSGGDIAEMYSRGVAGDFGYGQSFWRDEYRMNAKIAKWRKPIISFLQGYTMGGGVGIGCHGSHRIVCESSVVAMPECGIGLVPDVGGSFLLANAPGCAGEFLGVTGSRMGPDDAIYAGFADHFVPESRWSQLIEELADQGKAEAVVSASETPPQGKLRQMKAEIDAICSGNSIAAVARALEKDGSEFAAHCIKQMQRNSPLSMACAFKLIRMQRATKDIEQALELEFRYTHRSLEHSDFIEGIRALIIDKDNKPSWRFQSIADVPANAVEELLAPLPEDEVVWRKAL